MEIHLGDYTLMESVVQRSLMVKFNFQVNLFE